MTYYIKQRALTTDGKKRHKPKSQYIYSIKDLSGDNVKTYDIDGNLVHFFPSGQSDHYNYQSVGKGQYMIQRPSPTSGAQILCYDRTHIDNNDNVFFINLHPNADETITEAETYPLFKFIGTPFYESGDNDRYIITSQLTNDGKYIPNFYNIDKQEWKTDRSGETGSNINHSFAYDGDYIYFISDNNWLNKYDMELDNQWSININSYKSNIISGISQYYIFISSNNSWYMFEKNGDLHFSFLDLEFKQNYKLHLVYPSILGDNDFISIRDSGIFFNDILLLENKDTYSNYFILFETPKDNVENQSTIFITDIFLEENLILTYDNQGNMISNKTEPYNSFPNSYMNVKNVTNSYDHGKFYEYGLQQNFNRKTQTTKKKML